MKIPRKVRGTMVIQANCLGCLVLQWKHHVGKLMHSMVLEFDAWLYSACCSCVPGSQWVTAQALTSCMWMSLFRLLVLPGWAPDIVGTCAVTKGWTISLSAPLSVSLPSSYIKSMKSINEFVLAQKSLHLCMQYLFSMNFWRPIHKMIIPWNDIFWCAGKISKILDH